MTIVAEGAPHPQVLGVINHAVVPVGGHCRAGSGSWPSCASTEEGGTVTRTACWCQRGLRSLKSKSTSSTSCDVHSDAKCVLVMGLRKPLVGARESVACH